MIRIATLNIRSGRAVGLEAALRALQQRKVNIGVLQETKLMQGIHTWHVLGCDVWATEVESRHLGGGSSGMDIKGGVVGRGLCQLWPKSVKFLVDDEAAEMVRHWGLRAHKRRAQYRASGRGARECSKGRGGNTDRSSQRESTRTVRRTGGRTCDGGEGLWHV